MLILSTSTCQNLAANGEFATFSKFLQNIDIYNDFINNKKKRFISFLIYCCLYAYATNHNSIQREEGSKNVDIVSLKS